MNSTILELFQAYGLVGLMVGAVLVLSVMFLNMLERKDKTHNENIKTILSEERAQRRETNERFATANDKLSDAIKELSEKLSEN